MTTRPTSRILQTRGPDGRIVIDFGALPARAPMLIAAAIALVVGGLAVLVSHGRPEPGIVTVAVGAAVGLTSLAVIAFVAARRH